MKIVIDSDIPYIRGVLEPYALVAYIKGTEIRPDDVRDADALIVRTRTHCDRRLLYGSAVKIVASATIGTDHIDTGYCVRAGIEVANAAGSNARGVLQWVAATLALDSRRTGWQPGKKTIGVVGVGQVGSLIAQYAAGWGFRVLCCDPPRKRAESGEAAGFVTLEHIAAEADIITFHTPLSRSGQDSTFHIADADLFGVMKPGTLLINSSRGEVVDTESLITALEAGRCSVAIDTWEREPDIDRRLLSLSETATFHIAGYTAQGKANATSMSVQAVARRFGLPLTDWYPSQSVPRVTPSPISWEDLVRTIGSCFDIAALTTALKAAPQDFELLRNRYDYRQEYF